MPHDPNATPSENDEFFVGYFPSPVGVTRFALAIAIGVLIAGIAVAAAGAYLQRPPGEAHERNAAIDGVLIAEPYGMVRYLDAGRARHVLLVRGGKFGAPARDTRRFANRAVHVSGLLLERDGRQMLELQAPIREAALDAGTLAQLRASTSEDRGDATLHGQIVDSKCYLGRMRPGDGRTHRACAQLCITGNIPPVLVANDAHGRTTHYLLASTDNRSVARDVLPFVAEPVEIRGRLVAQDDLLILRIGADAIHRR